MAYPKSYWIPNEQDVGQYWRSFYNRYLIGDITPGTIEKIVKDHDQILDEGASYELKELKLGYALLFTYGPQTYDILERIVSLLDGTDRRRGDRLLSILAPALLNQAYSPALVAERGRWPFDTEMDGVFRQKFDPHVTRLLEEIEHDSAESKTSEKLNHSYTFRRICDRTSIIINLYVFRALVNKTWDSDSGFTPWTGAEFQFVDEYYKDRALWIYYDGEWSVDDNPAIDPMKLEIRSNDIPIPGPGGLVQDLEHLFYTYMFALVCDFVDEIIFYINHEIHKGSARCQECGQFYSRSFYGHGQKYCSRQCKSRAAKRRQRSHTKSEAFKRRTLK